MSFARRAVTRPASVVPRTANFLDGVRGIAIASQGFVPPIPLVSDSRRRRTIQEPYLAGYPGQVRRRSSGGNAMGLDGRMLQREAQLGEERQALILPARYRWACPNSHSATTSAPSAAISWRRDLSVSHWKGRHSPTVSGSGRLAFRLGRCPTLSKNGSFSPVRISPVLGA